MSLYRNILARAWKVTWRYKYLWFFGLFAALLGNGGEYEVVVRGLNGETGEAVLPAWRQLAATNFFSRQTVSNAGDIVASDPFSLFALLAVILTVLILCGFLVWLAVVSQISLVSNGAAHLAGKKGDFRSGLDSGIRNFWPVLGLNVTSKLVIFLAFVLIGLPLILTAARSAGALANVLYVAAFVVFIAVAMAFSFIIKYSIAYAVVKGNAFWQAIKSGWQLFAKNWLVSLEMALILFIINLLAGLVLVFIILILAVPFLFFALLLYKLASVVGFWLIAGSAFVLFLAIIILGGAILSTFQISSWTALFLELINKGGLSKIVRIVEGWKSENK